MSAPTAAPAGTAGTELWAERAWLGPGVGFGDGVHISCSPAGFITGVETGVARSACAGAVRIGGDVCLPGFVNAHSHAFHRALRGVTEASSGSFWTWRETMYQVAGALDPGSYRELACLVYAEMLLAGYTCVGEFHYLHHAPGGAPYADPNEMGHAVVSAAAAAGMRLTLIDACYLQAGVDGSPLTGVQLRFGDVSGERWSERVSRLLAAAAPSPRLVASTAPTPRLLAAAPLTPGLGNLVRFGVAAHSVRATPPAAIETVAALAAHEELPLHVHLSEQRRENEECLQVLGLTPTDLLADCGALTAGTTAVHATHVTTSDLGRLGLAECGVCACPTTERDLGDGIGPFSDLADAGAVLSIGSDSHAVIDPFEETRAIELDERLSMERRGVWRLPALLSAATAGGSRALRWPEGGIRVGAVADLVGIAMDSPRMAGYRSVGVGAEPGDEELLARILFSASPADVETVVVGGRVVVDGGEHVTLGPSRALAERLGRAISAALEVPL